MSGKGVVIQGVLAFLVLLGAFFTWQRPPELSVGETFVLNITKNDLQKVRFEDEKGKAWAELSKAEDPAGGYVAIRLSGFDSTGVPLPSGHPGIPLKKPERLVRGNVGAEEIMARFAPLRASRTLGVLDDDKLKELGLDKPEKFLEVTARGQTRRFAIVPAPPGGMDPYIQDVKSKQVYVVERRILHDLQAAATNLVDRRLQPFRIEDVDRLIVTAGDKKQAFVASRIEDFPGIRLAPAETPDKPDATMKNWHDRVWKLFPTEVLGKGEIPESGLPQVRIKVEYFGRGRPLGTTELATTGGATAASSTDKPPPVETYAKSDLTLGWFLLSKEGEALLTEGESLLARQ